MQRASRTPIVSIILLFAANLACGEPVEPAAADEAESSDGACMAGLQGCECYLGFCEQGLECVNEVCVDPNCQPGSELCSCANGDQCFSGLECVAGICQSAGGESTTSASTTGESTTGESTTGESTTGESTTGESTTGESTTGDGCEPNASLQCVGNAVYWFDSCGNMGQLEQTCSAQQMCVEPSPDSAECQDIPPACGDGTVDPGEDCENGQLGGATCMSQGFDGGQLACTSCLYDTDNCYECECSNGECCSDGCYFDDAATVCDPGGSEYGCPNGTDPGDDVSVRTHDRYCSGNSASCTGNYGPWSGWSLADNCSDSEYCSPGDPTCNPCNWSYVVSLYQCQNFSVANGGGNGGGEIFKVCASTNAQGYMTVKARKNDNSTFSNRPYQVRVSSASDDPCGPLTNYFTISDSDPVGIGTNELTFEFQSVWLAGQTQKAYCVTASTKVGDLGYDPNNPQQQSWWYSKKALLDRSCN